MLYQAHKLAILAKNYINMIQLLIVGTIRLLQEIL